MLFRRREDPQSTAIRDRIDLLRKLASRPGCESYLEIGCNRDKVFREVDVARKIGVDPKRGGTHRMTSDAFFEQNELTFDLVFIDGLHHADQVLRDVGHALAVLNEGGVIVLHDCNPAAERLQRVPPPRDGEPWNGDVWKAVVLLRCRCDVDVAVGDFDYGCGVLLRRPNSLPLVIEHTLDTLSYGDLAANRRQWLRLMTGAELLDFIDPARGPGARRG
jgi:SAM-dependent methyltransferase